MKMCTPIANNSTVNYQNLEQKYWDMSHIKLFVTWIEPAKPLPGIFHVRMVIHLISTSGCKSNQMCVGHIIWGMEILFPCEPVHGLLEKIVWMLDQL